MEPSIILLLGVSLLRRPPQSTRHAIYANEILLQTSTTRRLLMAATDLGLLACIARRTYFHTFGKGAHWHLRHLLIHVVDESIMLHN